MPTINPVPGRREALRLLEPGDRVVWYVAPGELVTVQKRFAGAAAVLGIEIRQRTALMVATRGDEVPETFLIIERLGASEND